MSVRVNILQFLLSAISRAVFLFVDISSLFRPEEKDVEQLSPASVRPSMCQCGRASSVRALGKVIQLLAICWRPYFQETYDMQLDTCQELFRSSGINQATP